ncbi:MAG TPA: CPBP family intramembrane glutamic endopeptidase [Chitinophagaceae bacterium]|nr:CPBP family intramembrane glutamic endopeptidase [Chitinophagaceae bacterium]
MTISILILKYAMCYCAFFAMLLLSKPNGGYKLFDKNGPAQNTGALFGSQIAGIVWLGLVPVFTFDQSWIDIVFGIEIPDFFPVVIIILLLIAVSLFARIQSENRFGEIVSNQKTVKIFSRDFILRYILLRLLFLCAYEIFLRGYLLTDSIHYLGITKAVLLNIALYTLLHLPADKKEIIACIPFGALLCLVCIWFQVVWPAILLHVSLSLVYEINLLKKFHRSINAVL